MEKKHSTLGRRSFLKSTTLAGGGLMIGFGWLAEACKTTGTAATLPGAPTDWAGINGYIKIAPDGRVTIMSPNPEIGQNVKTTMPMIVADELDVAWEQVTVEQAGLNTEVFKRQLAGGSQSIRAGWEPLRTAGATGRQMLRTAAAQTWNVPVEEVTTSAGRLYHKPSGRSAGYGDMATAASKVPVPEKVKWKDIKDFTIIGTPRRNVDAPKIVTGQTLYGLDFHREGMLIAMIAHPPAFGLQLKSVDATQAKAMPGIRDVFTIQVYKPGQSKSAFDITAFNDLVVVVGDTTWQVMQAKKALRIEWEEAPERIEEMNLFGNKSKVRFPAGLESSRAQSAAMAEKAKQPGKVVRKDGDPEAAFQRAAKVIERTYTAPYLAHSCMEPMNFFAHVTDDKAELVGAIQTPEFLQKSVAERLGLPLEKVSLQMTRMGGGFGRRLYGHYVVEVAVISQKMRAPIKLIYSREDEMTMGIYRPPYHITYRAALDADKNLIGFHVKAGGIPDSPLFANRYPAGTLQNYLAESWSIDSNITTGAFRAPGSNFTATAEQSFLDEVAEAMGQDPIAMRLALFQQAKTQPVGKNNDYDASRYAGVIELVREKSGWNTPPRPGIHRGMAAYYCHNTYVAHVVEVSIKNGSPVVEKVYCAVDCGIVVNPLAATNLAEGGSIDGIGHAMYGAITIKEGSSEQQNFNDYRLIRQSEAPKSVEVHFVKNEIDPTGLGEPPYPPVMAALANALYRATGKRYYQQPFAGA